MIARAARVGTRASLHTIICFRLLDRRSTRCAHNKVVIKLAVSFSNT